MEIKSSAASGGKYEDSTDKQPLISVIIIFYNAEVFLEEAVQSVLAQTYPHWELILVDDGSTDRSTIIAKTFAECYPKRISYREHPDHQNLDMPVSRNLGLRHASGEFVAFLDSDDVWMPEKLEQQLAILENHPEAALVYGRSEYWYSWTGQPDDISKDFIIELKSPAGLPIRSPHIFSKYFIHNEFSLPGPSNFMVRRQAVQAVGGFEELFIRTNNVYEDQAFLAKLFLIAPVIASDACWDRYRQHPDSSCSVAEDTGKTHQARAFFLTWLAGYLEEQGFNDPAVMGPLRREIFRYRHPKLPDMENKMKQAANRIRLFPFQLAYRVLPSPLFEWLRAKWRGEPYRPPPGRVRLGNLRRTTPFSREFGYDRGQPVDRYYIENFLSQRQSDIQGRVLEIADDAYTRQFGGEWVTRSEVLSVSPEDRKATLIGDLVDLDHVPGGGFDCIILTQTLQLIYDPPAALRSVHRLLKPGGVALVTFPGISPISRYDADRWGYFWSFTSLSARRMFESFFPADHIRVEAHGNVLAATAFLYGMASLELKQEELDHLDPDYEVTITVRAQKPFDA